jgi:RNA polymerase sigma-70 factor (ECF subfamily)
MEKTKYYSEIKRYIASRIRNPDDVEDMTQHVFLEFYQKNNGDSDLQNPKAYLFGIARKMIGLYCSKKRKVFGFLQIDTGMTDRLSYNNYNKDSKTRELIEEIEIIISQLPPKARESVELRLIDNLSPAEAAQKSDCSVDRFYDRFHEGMKILKEKVQAQLL